MLSNNIDTDFKAEKRNGSHYNYVRMGTMASHITSLTIVYSTVYSGAAQRKHQSSAPLAFVWGIHRGPVNSPHNWPVTRKMFPFDDVIMSDRKHRWYNPWWCDDMVRGWDICSHTDGQEIDKMGSEISRNRVALRVLIAWYSLLQQTDYIMHDRKVHSLLIRPFAVTSGAI